MISPSAKTDLHFNINKIMVNVANEKNVFPEKPGLYLVHMKYSTMGQGKENEKKV